MTYILFNPIANKGRGSRGLDEVRAAFADDAPALYDITATDTAAFLRGLGADDRVILCGGDGTLHRLVNDLGGRCPAVPLYMWRFGTGNDFLRDISSDGGKVVRIDPFLQDLPRAEIDGKIHFFLNGCSGGVDALVCRKMNEDREKKPSYVTTALRSFFREYEPTSVSVTTDGETREYRDVWMAGAMNGRFQGGGMLFGPGQDRSGDTLFVYVWHGTGPLSTLLHFPTVMRGTYARFRDHCEVRHGREITLAFGAPRDVQLDGETISGVTRFTIRKGRTEVTG